VNAVILNLNEIGGRERKYRQGLFQGGENGGLAFAVGESNCLRKKGKLKSDEDWDLRSVWLVRMRHILATGRSGVSGSQGAQTHRSCKKSAGRL